MNNLQRVEKLCENEQWSTSHGMRQLLNTIAIIGRDKDEPAFNSLLEYCRHSVGLSEFVCDSPTTTALLRSQWSEVWGKYIREFISVQPENVFKLFRLAQINPTMLLRAQEVVWEDVLQLESKKDSVADFVGQHQALLCCIALAAVEINDVQLYDKCIEHWRIFDRMHSPLYYNWNQQIETAAMGCQSWLMDRIIPYTNKNQYLIDYIERILPLGAASDVEMLIKKVQHIPSHKYTSSTVRNLITNTPKLWTSENLLLVKNLFQMEQDLKHHPGLLSKVIPAAFHAHLNDGMNFSECLEICDMACASQYFHLNLKDLVQVSVKFNDFRLLQHLSEKHSSMYSSTFSEEVLLGAEENGFAQLLFNVDGSTDALIAQSPLKNEQIDIFRQKLRLSDVVGSSSLISKRKL